MKILKIVMTICHHTPGEQGTRPPTEKIKKRLDLSLNTPQITFSQFPNHLISITSRMTWAKNMLIASRSSNKSKIRTVFQCWTFKIYTTLNSFRRRLNVFLLRKYSTERLWTQDVLWRRSYFTLLRSLFSRRHFTRKFSKGLTEIVIHLLTTYVVWKYDIYIT